MAGTWQPLANQPNFNASTMLLLTDGRVMCQDAGTANWHMLTPDAYSGPNRPPVPMQTGHPFRRKSATVPEHSGHRLVGA